MAKSGQIGHEGVVKQVSGQTIEIVITNHSACSGCHAKGACGMADLKQKIITTGKPDFEVAPGDKVMVYASTGNAIFSVVMAYIFPTVVIIGTIFILTASGQSEIIAATASLLVTAIYFVILYFNRKHIGKKIIFTVDQSRDKD